MGRCPGTHLLEKDITDPVLQIGEDGKIANRKNWQKGYGLIEQVDVAVLKEYAAIP